MAKTKKTRTVRPWTATDLRILKGLAKQKVGVAKITKSLKGALQTNTTVHLVKISLRPGTVDVLIDRADGCAIPVAIRR